MSKNTSQVKEKLILGINPTGPNTSACLYSDKRGIIAFTEEERFTRVKLATDVIPVRSIKYCLTNADLNLSQVDLITVGWNHTKYPEYMANFYKRRMSHPKKDELSINIEKLKLIQKSSSTLKKNIEIAFKRSGIVAPIPKIVYKNHHECHVASVFFPSPFEKSLAIVIDGSGEELATSIWICERGKKFNLIDKYELPDSIGYFYGAMTEYLGFSIFTGEGKVMGMAPYGKPNKDIRNRLNDFIKFENNRYTVDPKYVYFGERNSSFKHTDDLVELLGVPARIPESEIKQIYYDIAYETQSILEEIVKTIVSTYIRKTGINDICIAGGVANNCKMNGIISSLKEVKGCFVIPASADNGVSYGSSILHVSQTDLNNSILRKRFDPYLGPSYTNEEIKKVLIEAKIKNYKEFKDINSLVDKVSDYLSEGKIIGWFQGRMEVGARALGNRSILANPAYPNMKDKINKDVKRREAFRPFAPSILEEYAEQWFDFSSQKDFKFIHKYMIQATYAKDIAKEKIPSIVHVDGSIRPQIVCEEDNKAYYQLIKDFYTKTGIPVLLNTSFNVRGEPIVCKPDEALRCFISHGLDVLVMGNTVMTKF